MYEGLRATVGGVHRDMKDKVRILFVYGWLIVPRVFLINHKND